MTKKTQKLDNNKWSDQLIQLKKNAWSNQEIIW